MVIRRLLGGGLMAGALALVLVGAPRASLAERKSAPPSARSARQAKHVGSIRTGEPKKAPRGCKKQKAKPFLIRGNFMQSGMLLPTKHQKAVRWRAERYGWVPGLEGYASESAISQAAQMTFMGLPLRVHKKIVPKLRCVERTIRQSCKGPTKSYVPKAIGGFREANSYRQGEVSNHLFGIAVDIDPDRNPCCGCVDPWPTHPACNTKPRTPFAISELPKCWVDSFEQYGFYWLGRDKLEDTMHFEFLGDPDK